MIPFLRTIVVFCVITLGAGLGAEMHSRVQQHDAALRTPGEVANRHIIQTWLACKETSNPDRCALLSGITI